MKCEAYHTFEAKLRNASTLLWLGKATLLALQTVAKYSFHFNMRRRHHTFQFSVFTFQFKQRAQPEDCAITNSSLLITN